MQEIRAESLVEDSPGSDSDRCSGILLLIRPFEAAEIMMILVGVSVLFEGILNLCVAIYTVKIIKNQKQDIIDMDEY